ncbi:hypothetical protein MPDQ_008212 [Monascus purpureus]|uniref:Adipose-regulatory protein-domain-containing protein n=1 Tax=Monascus purpureus TaxID=5098 RepID=A0A507QTW9_MONPU|nr:hypothetical protein MPDQ_008212 [Monascus purpureus]BDD56854.1 hypothetical protein MAP00_002273 [Monascus purpureus]
MTKSQYTENDGTSRKGSSLLRAVGGLFSKEAWRVYLRTFLFISTSTLLLCVSAIAYWVFYTRYIPQIGLERVVHLQFGDGHPWGTALIGSELVSLQPYDVSVRLQLPRTPSNFAAGNFMLDLALLSHPLDISTGKGVNVSTVPMVRSRRPAILTYASPLVDTANRLSYLPLYVVGWHREEEILDVQMMEQVEFARGWSNLPGSLHLRVESDERMQIYSAKVEFKARFTGLRWVMYNWRLSSFAIFSTLFWSISVLSTGAAWAFLAFIFGSRTERHTKYDKRRDRDKSESPIKEETDDEAVNPHSVGPTIKEEDDLAEQPSASPQTSEADDEYDSAGEGQSTDVHSESGAGTGFESPGARRLQRRRSHFQEVLS